MFRLWIKIISKYIFILTCIVFITIALKKILSRIIKVLKLRLMYNTEKNIMFIKELNVLRKPYVLFRGYYI